MLSPGHGADYAQALPLLEGFTTQAVIADNGYDSDEIVNWISSRGAQAVIPPRSSRKTPRDCDSALYAERHRIECYFNRLKHYRGIATRYCKRAKNFASFIYLAASVQWLL